MTRQADLMLLRVGDTMGHAHFFPDILPGLKLPGKREERESGKIQRWKKIAIFKL